MNLALRTKGMNCSKLIAAFAISLVVGISVLAQQTRVQPAEGKIVGQLRDLCGVGIAKAVVRIKGGKVKRKIKSSGEGKFEVHLPVGNYETLVEKYGFKRYMVGDVQVTADSVVTVSLAVEAGYASDDPNADKESLKPCRPPNNGMHPTPHHATSHDC